MTIWIPVLKELIIKTVIKLVKLLVTMALQPKSLFKQQQLKTAEPRTITRIFRTFSKGTNYGKPPHSIPPE